MVAHLPCVRLQLGARASSSAVSWASRNASSGALASTTICLPPGRWTIRSGRSRPLSVISGLLVEVAALHHARNFDDAPQLHLAPAAAHGRRPQRAGQRVVVEPRAATCSVRRRSVDPIALGFAEPLVDPFQRVGDRLVKGRERRLGQIEERRAVVLERLRGQRLKRVAQSLVGLVEERLLRRSELRQAAARASAS